MRPWAASTVKRSLPLALLYQADSLYAMDLASLSQLQTEAVNPRTAQIDQVSTLDMCKLINEDDHHVASSVTPFLPQISAAIDALTPRVRHGGRVIYVGAGTSGRSAASAYNTS